MNTQKEVEGKEMESKTEGVGKKRTELIGKEEDITSVKEKKGEKKTQVEKMIDWEHNPRWPFKLSP